MTDINKLIEEEAERFAIEKHSDDIIWEIDRFETRKDFKAGASFILHLNRWRKFSTDELPHIGQQIVCKSSSGRYHLSNPISHDGIHWLAENFIEWKPI